MKLSYAVSSSSPSTTPQRSNALHLTPGATQGMKPEEHPLPNHPHRFPEQEGLSLRLRTPGTGKEPQAPRTNWERLAFLGNWGEAERSLAWVHFRSLFSG